MKRIALTLFAASQVGFVANAAGLNCSEQMQQLNRQVRVAETRLEIAKENEANYKELLADATSSSRISTTLFVSSSLLLSGGITGAALTGLGGKTAGAPIFHAVTEALIGTSRTAAGVLVLSPVVMTVGAAGAGLVAEVALPKKIKEGELQVEELTEANKNFDQAQALLAQKRSEINLDYSQYTDVLGFRDRSTTRKLAQIAQASREVEELRLAHFQISQQALNQACQ